MGTAVTGCPQALRLFNPPGMNRILLPVTQKSLRDIGNPVPLEKAYGQRRYWSAPAEEAFGDRRRRFGGGASSAKAPSRYRWPAHSNT